jgi:hypothetical protein
VERKSLRSKEASGDAFGAHESVWCNDTPVFYCPKQSDNRSAGGVIGNSSGRRILNDL